MNSFRKYIESGTRLRVCGYAFCVSVLCGVSLKVENVFMDVLDLLMDGDTQIDTNEICSINFEKGLILNWYKIISYS